MINRKNTSYIWFKKSTLVSLDDSVFAWRDELLLLIVSLGIGFNILWKSIDNEFLSNFERVNCIEF